ncbi:unnamed protein product [Gongylonema pulchrum]|uniref:TRAF-type domain-containing protein n=1 Tax=Gongylonema pulchrum TaxID=637853 RepID=A0A183DP72_9BILA|nr:unnamed protein product [Gongylonema pulchrum]
MKFRGTAKLRGAGASQPVMLPSASSSSSSSLPRRAHDAAQYSRCCDLCSQEVVLCSRFEFAQHLRRMHCTREGGSFICRYGSNGVCQSLPLEGVSDDDYEAHIRKCHANVGEKFLN